MKKSNILVSDSKNILNENSMTFEEREKELNLLKQQEEERLNRERKSPFKNFIQINKEQSDYLDSLMKQSPIAYRIFMFLANNMDNYNAVMCSYKTLEEYFEVSTDTIRRSIKILKEKKYIYVVKSGSSNIYALNDELVWNSWGTNKRYSKFPANIIISLSEQEKITQIKANKIKTIEIPEKN